MKNSLVVLLFILPGFLSAQTEGQTGIRFEDLPNWNTVLAKAKQENKFIFVDCFATWCGPCKKMDKDIYPIDSIGRFFSANFLSVKIQIDSTAKDDEQIKKWHADARSLQREFNITSLPTFLFFSPEGKLVHKGIGYMYPAAFSLLAHHALNPGKQYYTLLETFQQGKLAYTGMPELLDIARSNNDARIADTVSGVYVNNYLLKLKENEIYTKTNLGIIASTIHSSHDNGLKIFYSHAARVDTIMKTKNFSQIIVDHIIEREEINRRLYKDGKPFNALSDLPNWEEIHRTIKRKYNTDYADRVVLWAKIKWLEYKKDWPEYCKNVILKVEKYGAYIKMFPDVSSDASMFVNFSAWEIFMHSTDSNDLKKVLGWSYKTISDTSNKLLHMAYLDTYANLLYKLGRTQEALVYEEKALQISAIDPASEIDIKNNFVKIKSGQPTW